jgi:hypothetical protein
MPSATACDARNGWKHIAADLCRSDFPVAEIDARAGRKLHREMVRIAVGQATDSRWTDKDQPRRSADTITGEVAVLFSPFWVVGR